MRNIFILLTIVSFYSCLSLDDTVYDRIPESKFPENESQAVLKVVPTYRELADLIDDAGWWFWVCLLYTSGTRIKLSNMMGLG